MTWGADALPRLNGMYAFAYWDGRGQRLLLGRDPLGIKPLLLARTARGLVFASELRGAPEIRRRRLRACRLAPFVRS